MKMNKELFGLLIAVALVSSIPTSFAQQNLVLVDPALENPPDCDLVTYDKRAYIPFEIRTFYEFVNDAKMEDTQIGNSNPVITKTPRTYFFNTNEIDEYSIQFSLQYENVQTRAVKVEVISAGEKISEEVIPFSSGMFCKNFHIITSEKPHLPTLEEAYGDAIVTMIEEVPNFVPAFEQNTINTSNALFFIGLGMAIVILVVVVQFFVYLSRKSTDKKQRENVESASLAVTKNLRDTETIMEDIKEFQETERKINQNFMDKAMIENNSAILDMKKDMELFIDSLKLDRSKLETKYVEDEKQLQQKRDDLEKEQTELQSILDVEDEGTLRGILNIVPTGNLRTLGKMLRNKSDPTSNKVKKVLQEVFQRRSMTEEIPEEKKEEPSKKFNVKREGDKTTPIEEEKDDVIPLEASDRIVPTPEETPEEPTHTDPEPVEEEEEDEEEDEVEDEEIIDDKCKTCRTGGHCNADNERCECSCCYEETDLDSEDDEVWQKGYDSLDYDGLRKEWERINKMLTEEYINPLEHEQRVGYLQQKIKEMNPN
jgi:hypothetical protein